MASPGAPELTSDPDVTGGGELLSCVPRFSDHPLDRKPIIQLVGRTEERVEGVVFDDPGDEDAGRDPDWNVKRAMHPPSPDAGDEPSGDLKRGITPEGWVPSQSLAPGAS